MSFNDEVMKDGRGRAIRIDASLDKFATVSYRWSDLAGVLDGTNMYSARVLSLAPIRRGFGQNRIAAGGSTELVLDNADGALDALAGRESISTQAKLRLRIYVVLYEPGATSLSFTSKLLGEFALANGWVRQNNTTLTLPLGDDVIGAVSQQSALPTFNDWATLGTSANNPLLTGYALPDTLAEFSPIQLAFGEDWVLALPHVLPFGPVHANYEGKVIVPICTTSDTGAASSGEITNLRIMWVNPLVGVPKIYDVPQTVWDDVAEANIEVWRVERSPTITKDGKNFKVIYLVVRSDLGALNNQNNYLSGFADPEDAATIGSYGNPTFANEYGGGYSPNAVTKQREYASNDAAVPQYGRYGAGVVAWYVKGVPLSARTQTSNAIQHPVDVLTDLVDYYSNNTDITVDTTQGARVKLATATASCVGTVQPWQMGPRRGDPTFQQPPSLRQTITAICQSADIDVFINWSGQFSFSADFWDFRVTGSSSGWASVDPNGAVQSSGDGSTTAYTPAVIPETWLSGIERWLPSSGERWAPFNRLWMTGGRASPADGADAVPFQGPWDFFSVEAAVNITERVIEETLQQGWRPYRQQAQAPWFWRQVNVQARDMIRFRTHIGALQLDLGDYFLLGWSRGPEIGGPYSGATAFQVEAIDYSPGDDTVEVTAVWRNDVTDERQYLLDDETLLVRAKGGSDSLTLFVFGGIGYATPTADLVNFVAMGVQAGDILVLRDSTQAADEFSRNRAIRITGVISANNDIALDSSDLTGISGSVVNADWYIVRGATTYPDAVSDPTNYPLGGDAYGKVTDANGEYSNASTGNRLISG